MRNKLSTTLFTGAALACALLLAAPAARAQVPSYAPAALSGLPATIPAATTTNLASPVFVDASHAQKVAFQLKTSWSTAGESTGNTNLLYSLAPTVDGMLFDTNKPVTLGAYNYSATAGQSTINVTNLSADGIDGWYIFKIVNNSAAGVATNSVKQSIKQSSP